MKTSEIDSLESTSHLDQGDNASTQPEKTPGAITRGAKRILDMLKALWRATLGRFFGNRQSSPAPMSPELNIPSKPSTDGPDIDVGMEPEQTTDQSAAQSPALQSFEETPKPAQVFMLEDKEYGVNDLETGTRAFVGVEDGLLLPAEDRLLLETSKISAGMPPQSYTEVPKIRIDEQIAPMVDDPVGHFPYPVLLQMNNLIEPSKILEGFGVEASEDGTFNVGEKQLRIQKAENGEHVITEIGTGRALPAGNVSLVQLCRSEAGMEVIDQKNTASLLYDRFVAGNSISENGIQEIEAATSTPSVEALEFAAEAVGAPEILANFDILPNAEQLKLLPDDSPIVAVYDNVQDEELPMAIVMCVDGDETDQGSALVMDNKVQATGALEIAAFVLQNHNPDLTKDQAHQVIHERMSSPEQSNEAPKLDDVSMDV